jgi:hypothetical protein
MSWKQPRYILKMREHRFLGKSSECDTKKRMSNREVEINMRRKVLGKEM